MAVPKQHRSKAKVGKSRMHKYIKSVSLSICPKCKRPFLPHRVCPNCGYYKNKMVINVLEDLTRKERKIKEKELKETEKQKTGSLTLEELSKKNQ